MSPLKLSLVYTCLCSLIKYSQRIYFSTIDESKCRQPFHLPIRLLVCLPLCLLQCTQILQVKNCKENFITRISPAFIENLASIGHSKHSMHPRLSLCTHAPMHPCTLASPHAPSLLLMHPCTHVPMYPLPGIRSVHWRWPRHRTLFTPVTAATFSLIQNENIGN